MRNTIRLKILATATVLLMLFAATAGLSTYLVNLVVEEIDGIAEYHIPLTAHVAELDVLTYEYELDLRRLIAQDLIDPAKLAAMREHHKTLRQTIFQDIKTTNARLDAGTLDTRNDIHDRIAFALLKGSFSFLEKRLTPFLKIGDDMMTAIEEGDLPRARALAEGFGAFEDVFGNEIGSVRKALEMMTLSSVTETKENEIGILNINAALFAISTLFGLTLFIVLTSRLQRSFGQLLDGTKAVEMGELNIKLPVTSTDEIGQLTGAFNRMAGQLKEKEQIRDTFGKYLDPRIVTKLIEAQGGNETLSERRPATVFFSDIQGFSSISENLTATAMVKLLNSYFSAVTHEIRDYNGIIDKFIGDAVMAFWTTPFSAGDGHAADACLAALAQQQALTAFRGELPQITGFRRDPPKLVVRMGLATGEVVIGTIGSDISKSYTVIGDVVNSASRIEGVNKVFGTGIIIGDETRRLAQGAIETRELDLLTVVGKNEPLKVHELICKAGELTAEMAELRDLFHDGLAAYRGQDWETALRRFDDCLARKPDDAPALVFQNRVKFLRVTPPAEDWDGVWQLTVK
jgi:adenylate cyclase